MTCTNYNETINYNAPIPYNGQCASPVPVVVSGGFVNHSYHKKREIFGDDDFAIVLSVLELLDEE